MSILNAVMSNEREACLPQAGISMFLCTDLIFLLWFKKGFSLCRVEIATAPLRLSTTLLLRNDEEKREVVFIMLSN